MVTNVLFDICRALRFRNFEGMSEGSGSELQIKDFSYKFFFCSHCFFTYTFLLAQLWPLGFLFVFCFALSLVHSSSLLVKNTAISEGTKSMSP